MVSKCGVRQPFQAFTFGSVQGKLKILLSWPYREALRPAFIRFHRGQPPARNVHELLS